MVGNSLGTVYSQNAPLAINAINLLPTVVLTGTIGDTYVIQRSATVNGTYASFSTNKLTTVPQYIVDFTLPISPNEFYQSVFLY